MSQQSVTRRLFALFLLLGFVTNAAAASDDIEQEFAVGSGGLLSLESDSGSIDIRTWNEDRVRVRVRNPSGFDVDIDQSGDDVRVVADSRGSLFGIRRSNIGFTVDVPIIYNVELNTGGGSITVDDIFGEVDVDTNGGSISIGVVTGADVRADTSGGRIEIEKVDGDVVADTSGGNIEIGDVSGYVQADTSGGRIEIGNVQGNINADTSGGNIEVGESAGSVRLDTSGGSIRAGWAQGPIRVNTSGGNIYLAGSATSVSADTSGGSIVIAGSDGPVQANSSGGNITVTNARSEVKADTSGGRIEVEITSTSGSVDGSIDLETSGGDIILRIPSNLRGTVLAELNVSRRSRGDYRIYTDFPLTVQDDDGDIVGRGDINGGGAPIRLSTNNSDIHIVSVSD